MIEWLVITAAVLGTLAFFEPCTIATHTLFAVRSGKQPTSVCCRQLFIIWLSRSLLMVGLLLAAVAVFPAPQWGPVMPSVILAVIGSVYIISRFAYIPVPHLEFFRLAPRAERLPDAVKLGLTLPACTLPLVIVVAGLAVSVDSLIWAAVSAFLFASLFTLPIAIASWTGVSETTRDFLNRAATGSPYLTAVLLYGVAVVLLLPAVDLGKANLQSVLQEASLLGIGLGFLAGLVFSFNPVSIASIPVVLAYVTKAHEEARAIRLGSAFIAGMIVTHVVLGVAAALGGDWVKDVMGREWGLLLGPVLIVLGLLWPGWLHLRLPWITLRGRKVAGMSGAFLLGVPFSVAICPFCAPALLVALTASAAIGSVPFAMALLLAFALGRSIPIILGAWAVGWLESLKVLTLHQRAFEIVAGVTLILTGLYLLNEYFFVIKY